eukprot:g2010.t1
MVEKKKSRKRSKKQEELELRLVEFEAVRQRITRESLQTRLEYSQRAKNAEIKEARWAHGLPIKVDSIEDILRPMKMEMGRISSRDSEDEKGEEGKRGRRRERSKRGRSRSISRTRASLEKSVDRKEKTRSKSGRTRSPTRSRSRSRSRKQNTPMSQSRSRSRKRDERRRAQQLARLGLGENVFSLKKEKQEVGSDFDDAIAEARRATMIGLHAGCDYDEATKAGLKASKIKPGMEIFLDRPIQVNGLASKKKLDMLLTATLIGQGGIKIQFGEKAKGPKYVFRFSAQHVQQLIGAPLQRGPKLMHHEAIPKSEGLPISVIQKSCLALAELVRFDFEKKVKKPHVRIYETVREEQGHQEREALKRREKRRIERKRFEQKLIRTKLREKRRNEAMERAKYDWKMSNRVWDENVWHNEYKDEELQIENLEDEHSQSILSAFELKHEEHKKVSKSKIMEATSALHVSNKNEKSDNEEIQNISQNINRDEAKSELRGLPKGWEAHIDEETGATYYWHHDTGHVTWDHPTHIDTDGDGKIDENELKASVSQSLLRLLDKNGDGCVSAAELEEAQKIQRERLKGIDFVRPDWLSVNIDMKLNEKVKVLYEGVEYDAIIHSLNAGNGGEFGVKYSDGSVEVIKAKDADERIVEKELSEMSLEVNALGQPLVVEYEGMWHPAHVYAVSSSNITVRYEEDGSIEKISEGDAAIRVRAKKSQGLADEIALHEQNESKRSDDQGDHSKLDIEDSISKLVQSFDDNQEKSLDVDAGGGKKDRPNLSVFIAKDIWGLPVENVMSDRVLKGMRAQISSVVMRKALVKGGRPLVVMASLIGKGPGIHLDIDDVTGRQWRIEIPAVKLRKLLFNWLPSLLLPNMIEERILLLLELLQFDETGALSVIRDSIVVREDVNGEVVCRRVPLPRERQFSITTASTQLEHIYKMQTSLEYHAQHAQELKKRGLNRDAMPIMVKAKLIRDEIKKLKIIERDLFRRAGGQAVRLHWQTPKSYAAVILVQRTFRGLLGRQKCERRRDYLKRKLLGCRLVQRIWRGCRGREIAKIRKEEVIFVFFFARKLQGLVRVYLAICRMQAIRRWVLQKSKIPVLQRALLAYKNRRNIVQKRWMHAEAQRLNEESIVRDAEWRAGEKKRIWRTLTAEEKEEKKRERREQRKRRKRDRKNRLMIKEQIKLQELRGKKLRDKLDKEEAERLRSKTQLLKYGLEDFKKLKRSQNPNFVNPAWEMHFGFEPRKWSVLKEHPVFNSMGFKRVVVEDNVPFALRRLKSYQLMVMKGKKKFDPRKGHPATMDIDIIPYQIETWKHHPSFAGYDFKKDNREAIVDPPKWDFANMYDENDHVLPCFVCRRPNGQGKPNCPRCSYRGDYESSEEEAEEIEEDEEETEEERMERIRKKMASVVRDGGGLSDLALLGKSKKSNNDSTTELDDVQLKIPKKKKKKKFIPGQGKSHNSNSIDNIDIRGSPGAFNFQLAAQVKMQLNQRTRKLDSGPDVKKVQTKEEVEAARLAAIEESQQLSREALRQAFSKLRGKFTTFYVKAVPVGSVTQITLEECDSVEYMYELYKANAGPDGISNKVNVYVPTVKGIFRLSDVNIAETDQYRGFAPCKFTMKDWGFSTNGAHAAAFQCSTEYDNAARQLLVGFIRRNLGISESKLLMMMNMKMLRYPDMMPTDITVDAMQKLCITIFQKIHEMSLVTYAKSVLRAKEEEERRSLEQYQRQKKAALEKAMATRKAMQLVAKLTRKLPPNPLKMKKKKTAAQFRLEQKLKLLDDLGGSLGSDYSMSSDDDEIRRNDGGLFSKLHQAGDVREVKGGVSDSVIDGAIAHSSDDEEEKKDNGSKTKKKKKRKKKKKKRSANVDLDKSNMSLEERQQLLVSKRKKKKKKKKKKNK